ncbi:hypothetical protein ACPYO6_10175 [Georgenia sp. Z1344]|uniref:hypothetical protein n=1 Tax=Georgenia sp. Z1344 TaxID=3416706 RepID=UPI003CED2606
MSAGQDPRRTREEVGHGGAVDDPTADELLDQSSDLDDATEAPEDATEEDPDEVPEVNAWLTVVMFGFFVVATVACYIWLDGWH